MKLKQTAFNILAGTVTALLLLSFFAGALNLVLPERPLSLNDMHLLWLLDGKGFYLKENERGKDEGMMVLNPELRRMDNGRDKFTARKRPGTFRIFCVGGSTTRGWPFHSVVSYPRLLQLYLNDLLPGRNVEVINAGIMCSNSFSDIPLVQELMNYDPDAVLVYEGHNDRCDLPLYESKDAPLLKAHAWLLRHVYAYGAARMLVWGNTFDHAKMVRARVGKRFGFDQKRLDNAIENNFRIMNGIVRKKGCKLVIMTQACTPSGNFYDILRGINATERAFAARNGVGLIDIERSFRDSGLPDTELMLPDAVHPDIQGYAVMAQAVARGLASNNTIAPAGDYKWGSIKPDAFYFQQLGLTNEFLSTTYGDIVRRLADDYGATDRARHYLLLADTCKKARTKYYEGRRPDRAAGKSGINPPE